MVLGSYYLTIDRDTELGSGKLGPDGKIILDRNDPNFQQYRVFSSVDEAMMAYEDGLIGMHALIRVRMSKMINGRLEQRIVDATVGRLIFNANIPQDLGFV